jgi:CubicO group peptidase (beta-lactamase class C family)
MTVLREIEAWPTNTAAIGVTTRRRTRAIHGPLDEVFALASVTKPLAAWGVLVAVERGQLSLQDPAGPEGSTVAHLLAHASGMAPEAGGRDVAVASRRIYSNQAYELLGDLVTQATGVPFADWLDEAVFTPLGMNATALDGSPAKDGHASVRDLLSFARELLTPTLLSSELHAKATQAQWPELDGVLPGYGRQSPNPWGLGVEIRGAKSPHWTGPDAPAHTFGHFGQMGSFLWVDQEAGIACACLTGTAFGPWAIDAWAPFNQRVLEAFRD